MKILITGGLGFVGSSIVEYLLSKKFNVTVIDLLMFDNNQLKNFKKNDKFKFYKKNISDYKFFSNLLKNNCYDTIIHLAAIVGDPACKVNSDLTIDTNLVSSKKVFKLSKKFGIKNFIFFSTCSNYGMSKNTKLLKETSKLKPLSLYAKTKVEFEKFLQKDKSKVKKIILRISTLYGVSPRMRFDLTINEFTLKSFLNENLEIYHADTWRPYLNLKDLNIIVLKLLKNLNQLKNINIYNCGFSEENFTKKKIINEISSNVLKYKNYKFVDKDHFDKRNYKVDFNKIKKFGLKKTVTLSKGIKEIVNYLRKFRQCNFKKNVFYNHK